MVGKIHLSEKIRSHLPLGDTDSYRLVDGIGDGIPGLYLDEFAGRRLISTSSANLSPELAEWASSLGPAITTYWKHLDQHERKSPSLISGKPVEEPFEISERGIQYLVSFQSGYSQGIFLDQRDNRTRIRERCRPGDTILNTFAYTGAFSICAALEGATSTTLDLSQPYIDWTRKNMKLNGIDPSTQYFCRGDTFHWLRRFGRQKRLFTGIILDPPTFSRDQGGTVFRAEEHYGDLVSLAAACLAPGGWLLCTTNSRRLPNPLFDQMVHSAMPPGASTSQFPMPPDFTGEQYLKSILVET